MRRVMLVFIVAALLPFSFWWGNKDEDSPPEQSRALQLKRESGLERSGSLGMSPSVGTYTVGDRFTTQVYAESFVVSANAAEATIRYPTERLHVVEISREGSIFTLWTEEPTFSNTEGTIRFGGGIPTPGFLGNFGVILTITFEAVDEGVSVVEFEEGLLLANDGFGTNIAKEFRHGVYTSRQESLSRKGDLNDDGKVDFVDLSVILGLFGETEPGARGDLNNDGRVDFQDTSIVLAEWG